MGNPMVGFSGGSCCRFPNRYLLQHQNGPSYEVVESRYQFEEYWRRYGKQARGGGKADFLKTCGITEQELSDLRKKFAMSMEEVKGAYLPPVLLNTDD